MKKLMLLLIVSLAIAVSAKAALSLGEVYGGGVWSVSGFTEYELWNSPVVEAYGDEEVYVAVYGSGTISPVIVHGSTTSDNFGKVVIYSDAQMIKRFTPKGISSGQWDKEGWDDWVQYQYENSNSCWSWPNIWGTSNKANSNRRWICIPVKKSSFWSGFKTFRVGLKGTDDSTSTIVISSTHSDSDASCPVSAKHAFREFTLSGTKLEFALDQQSVWVGDGDTGECLFPTARIYDYNRTKKFSGPCQFSIKVNEGGTLVIAGERDEDPDESEFIRKKYLSVSGLKIVSDDGGKRLADPYSVDNIFRYNGGACRYVRKIKVSGATTLNFTLKNSCEIEITALKFFPSAKNSVSVGASYSCFSYYMPWGYLKGYVTGTGTYKEGEIISLKATTASGERFDHWEWLYGTPPENFEEIKNNPTLSFKATAAMCGTASQQKQIFVRAVWKETALVEGVGLPIGYGAVTGTGSYQFGATVKLTAKGATGYHFVGWEDDFVSWEDNLEARATRNVEVWDYDMCCTARFEANTYSIRFHSNGGTGSMAAVENVKYNKSATLPANTFKRSNSTFKGWATSASGAVAYANKAAVKNLTSTDGGAVTLYAVWGPVSSMTYYLQQTVSLAYGTLKGYSVSGKLPTGLKWSSSSGKLSGKPTKTGTWSVKFVKSKSTVSVKMTVKKDVVILGGDPSGTTYVGGGDIALKLGAKSYVGAPQKVSVSGLPMGLSYDAASGSIIGSPRVTGKYTATVKMTSAAGVSLSKPITVTIAPPAGSSGTRYYVADGQIMTPNSDYEDEYMMCQVPSVHPAPTFSVKIDSLGKVEFKSMNISTSGQVMFDDDGCAYFAVDGVYRDMPYSVMFEFDDAMSAWQGGFSCGGVKE